MPTIVELAVDPATFHNDLKLKKSIAKAVNKPADAINAFQFIKKSIDARGRNILFRLRVNVFIDETFEDYFQFEDKLQMVHNKMPVYIAGAGPAGMFAALRLIQLGYKPIILERGKNVKERRRDLAAMNKQGIVNPESNYCFGEGGAGTYSDGKLYTRSGKRGSIQECLQWFHKFGADENILYVAHPHIGTNKLPGIITAMREAIEYYGGEINFNQKLTDIYITNNQIDTIEINGQDKIKTKHLILATGHSARNIFEILDRRKIFIECKPFALGVRIEHPQELIDSIQYHCDIDEGRNEYLPPASYSVVTQSKGLGVFSFCMCPGGIIAPASTEEGNLVVNGWSPSKRDGNFANSGLVVTVDESIFAKYGFTGALAGMHFQESIEQKAWQAGGGQLKAPAQRLTDFVSDKISLSLPECSYLPGTTSYQLSEILPSEIYESMATAFFDFGTKMEGYFTSEAILLATESRTSSPVRIPRHNDTLEHIQIKGLYPCAEGAGYAGGIISAAMDGLKVAESLVNNITST